MSALTMGLAMDFERESRSGMAITSLWPAAVGRELVLRRSDREHFFGLPGRGVRRLTLTRQ
jgi:hypothetical protein